MVATSRLIYVHMKSSRAKVHLEALEEEVTAWIERPPYKISEWDDLDRWHYYAIDIDGIKCEIPLLVGDFVCCLRSALDQLAWALAHLDSTRKLTPRQEKRVNFLIFHENDSTYRDRRLLFPSAVGEVFDTIQPYLRGNAYRDDPLWQLDELWRLDKHIMIPANCQKIYVALPDHEHLGRDANGRMIFRLPMALKWLRPDEIKPTITPEILFGEYMGNFEVSVPRLREIYNFVCDEVIPKFAGFFS